MENSDNGETCPKMEKPDHVRKWRHQTWGQKTETASLIRKWRHQIGGQKTETASLIRKWRHQVQGQKRETTSHVKNGQTIRQEKEKPHVKKPNQVMCQRASETTRGIRELAEKPHHVLENKWIVLNKKMDRSENMQWIFTSH